MGGTVLEKNVTVGQRIMAGEPLYRVADLSSVWVDGEVYERDLGAMRVGNLVTATFDAGSYTWNSGSGIGWSLTKAMALVCVSVGACLHGSIVRTARIEQHRYEIGVE